MARIPFKASEPKGFSLLPKGTYLLRILEVEETTSKSKQEAMLKITHEIESNDEYNGRKVMRWFMIEGNASFRLRALCEVVIPDKIEVIELEEEDDKGNKLSSIDMDTDDLIGQAYYAECIVKYNKERQEDQNEWRKETSINAAAEDGTTDAEDAEEGVAEDEAEAEVEEEQSAPAKVAPATTKTTPATAKAGTKPAETKNTKPATTPAANTAPAGRARTRMQA